MENIYQYARLRYVLPLFFLTMFLPYFIEDFLFPDRLIADDSSIEALITMFASYVLPVICLWLVWCRKYLISEALGLIPTKHQMYQFALLGIPLVALSFLTVYLVFYPLSFIYPEFVKSWLLDMPEILRSLDSSADLRYNLANILVVVVLAPILEEFIFRGFIFGRLIQKTGLSSSIIITSVLFAVLHGEILGAFIFSVFVCLIRYRYQSLIAPMIVHMSNNLIVIIIIYIDQFVFNNVYEYTVTEFQHHWSWSIAGLLIGVPWLIWYFKNNLGVIKS